MTITIYLVTASGERREYGVASNLVEAAKIVESTDATYSAWGSEVFAEMPNGAVLRYSPSEKPTWWRMSDF